MKTQSSSLVIACAPSSPASDILALPLAHRQFACLFNAHRVPPREALGRTHIHESIPWWPHSQELGHQAACAIMAQASYRGICSFDAVGEVSVLHGFRSFARWCHLHLCACAVGKFDFFCGINLNTRRTIRTNGPKGSCWKECSKTLTTLMEDEEASETRAGVGHQQRVSPFALSSGFHHTRLHWRSHQLPYVKGYART